MYSYVLVTRFGHPIPMALRSEIPELLPGTAYLTENMKADCPLLIVIKGLFYLILLL